MVEERRFLNKQDKGLFITCITNSRHRYYVHYSTSFYLRMWRGPENISTTMRCCKKDFDLKKPESVSLPQLSSEIAYYITNLEQAAQKNAKCQGQIVYIKLGMMTYSHNPSTSWNPSTLEAEKLSQIHSRLMLPRVIQSPKSNRKNMFISVAEP